MSPSELDIDLSIPELNLDAITVPADLAAQGYAHDLEMAQHPAGVWFVSKDGRKKLVPWGDLQHPTMWALL